jgi:hypothetical protein
MPTGARENCASAQKKFGAPRVAPPQRVSHVRKAGLC